MFEPLLPRQCVHIEQLAKTKTALLGKIAEVMAENCPELNKTKMFDAFWNRESLGSTAIGDVVAIPHIRLAGVDQAKACFLKLQYPVDFGAMDKQPVDLVFSFIVPEHSPKRHLNILAALSKRFSEPGFRQCCRQASTEDMLFECLNRELLPILEIEASCSESFV